VSGVGGCCYHYEGQGVPQMRIREVNLSSTRVDCYGQGDMVSRFPHKRELLIQLWSALSLTELALLQGGCLDLPGAAHTL
jgi:hypothetical protein